MTKASVGGRRWVGGSPNPPLFALGGRRTFWLSPNQHSRTGPGLLARRPQEHEKGCAFEVSAMGMVGTVMKGADLKDESISAPGTDLDLVVVRR